MDNAFQELDYSDISAKNLSKKRRPGDINTKTRGGIIRLGSIIIIGLIIIVLIIVVISKSKTLSNLEQELTTLKNTVIEKEKDKNDAEEVNRFLEIEILENKKYSEQLSKQKEDIKNNIEKLEKSNKKAKEDVQNALEAISLIEGKLRDIENKKRTVEELQNNADYYKSEIDKLKNKGQ